ncbi:MAG TPA: phosphatase PAP2 family protein [Gemmatimonadaceae bacterium]|jgi:membrane-associated phospholipid phosphatase|nr:phosphatase PAP2 family protein [Gemmatimonadaceae bacterium]
MHILSLPSRFSIAFLAIAFPLQAVGAQVTLPSQPPRDTAHGAPLFTSRDAIRAVGFAGLTVAMFPLDRAIAHRLTDEHSEANKFLNTSSTGVELIADPGSIIIGASLYLFGRFTNHPDIEDLGWHGTEAVLLGGATAWVLKGLAGRARPFVTGDTTAHDFKFAGGFGNADRQSFPSGHTTAAFAAASAVTSEAERMWPGHFWLVAPLMYGGASLVGLSRMYHDKHWASDVALGAAIGTFSGLKVVRYTHAHPQNFLDRAILRVDAMPAPDGTRAAVVVSLPMAGN